MMLGRADGPVVATFGDPEQAPEVVAVEAVSHAFPPREDWGGTREHYCPVCRCARHYFHTGDGEIWIYDWCYHDGRPVSEEVRQLAALFYMFGRREPVLA